MPRSEQDILTIQDLRAVIHGLRMMDLPFVEEKAADEVTQMIKALPEPETLLNANSSYIKKLQADLKNIMTLIDQYAAEGQEYTIRYKSKTGLPPRYRADKAAKIEALLIKSSGGYNYRLETTAAIGDWLRSKNPFADKDPIKTLFDGVKHDISWLYADTVEALKKMRVLRDQMPNRQMQAKVREVVSYLDGINKILRSVNKSATKAFSIRERTPRKSPESVPTPPTPNPSPTIPATTTTPPSPKDIKLKMEDLPTASSDFPIGLKKLSAVNITTLWNDVANILNGIESKYSQMIQNLNASLGSQYMNVPGLKESLQGIIQEMQPVGTYINDALVSIGQKQPQQVQSNEENMRMDNPEAVEQIKVVIDGEEYPIRIGDDGSFLVDFETSEGENLVGKLKSYQNGFYVYFD